MDKLIYYIYYIYYIQYLMLTKILSLNSSFFSTLILAEHNGKTLSKNSYKLLSAANKFKQNTHILLTGTGTKEVIENIKATVPKQNVQKIFAFQANHPCADSIQNIAAKLVDKNSYKRVLGLSSSYGKDIIPRLSGKYASQPIGDVIEILSQKQFVRPTYAGNVLSTVQSEQAIDFITIRPSSFQQLPQGTNQAEVEEVRLENYQPLVTFVSEEKSDSNKPELTTAKVVISGGRGVKSKQNFELIYKLADAFGDAAVGASRAAVDANYCPNEMQVGQTGKVVAPQLYMAIGISGAVQHLAGMKDSKYIVAINNRPDEPIFQIADYGLEADLFKAVPQLTEKIRKIKSA